MSSDILANVQVMGYNLFIPVVHGDQAGTQFSSCNGKQEWTFSLYIQWSPHPPKMIQALMSRLLQHVCAPAAKELSAEVRSSIQELY